MIYLCQDINKTQSPPTPNNPPLNGVVGQNRCYLHEPTGSTWTIYGKNQSQYLMCANGCVQWEAGFCVGAMIMFTEI